MTAMELLVEWCNTYEPKNETAEEHLGWLLDASENADDEPAIETKGMTASEFDAFLCSKS